MAVATCNWLAGAQRPCPDPVAAERHREIRHDLAAVVDTWLELVETRSCCHTVCGVSPLAGISIRVWARPHCQTVCRVWPLATFGWDLNQSSDKVFVPSQSEFGQGHVTTRPAEFDPAGRRETCRRSSTCRRTSTCRRSGTSGRSGTCRRTAKGTPATVATAPASGARLQRHPRLARASRLLGCPAAQEPRWPSASHVGAWSSANQAGPGRVRARRKTPGP